MKSYFAKLAERATMGNPTASLPMRAKQSRVVQDLIHESESEPLPSTPSTARPKKRQAPAESISQSEVFEKRAEATQRSEPVASTEKLTEEFELPVISRFPMESPRVNRETEATLEVFKPPGENEPITHRGNDEPRESRDDSNNSEFNFDFKRFEAVEQDQINLLRRADEFMGDLLAPKRQRDEQLPSVETVIDKEPSAISRLQPTPSPVSAIPPPPGRTTEHAESPSLVIGNLTVEVSSPPQSSPQSNPVIVVQRGVTRSSTPLSSRRFGLGQF